MRAKWTAVRRWFGTCKDRGMTTAEYAVGTLAATALAGGLFEIVTSTKVKGLLLHVVERALRLAG
ncbi:DUF4244 domain-containing protein [Actinomadura decatromicini]|uniref:DUF4244 domain-containing protein n=1 Tax=Actinomadura decatromicini TaxID=2604572 RepID=A0A5D3FRC8_9ACTN|nr:DUF4244 domain-containing protein [Actinomadura decatromicini]TYK50783.1 DUF4244 domain-containing protein [Actinomadura decatromicini]